MRYILYVLVSLFLSLSNVAYSDYAHPYQVSFQDPATPVMEGVISLHHDLLFILTIIGIFIITLYSENKKY